VITYHAKWLQGVVAMWELLSGAAFETLSLLLQSHNLIPDADELQQCMEAAMRKTCFTTHLQNA